MLLLHILVHQFGHPHGGLLGKLQILVKSGVSHFSRHTTVLRKFPDSLLPVILHFYSNGTSALMCFLSAAATAGFSLLCLFDNRLHLHSLQGFVAVDLLDIFLNLLKLFLAVATSPPNCGSLQWRKMGGGEERKVNGRTVCVASKLTGGWKGWNKTGCKWSALEKIVFTHNLSEEGSTRYFTCPDFNETHLVRCTDTDIKCHLLMALNNVLYTSLPKGTYNTSHRGQTSAYCTVHEIWYMCNSYFSSVPRRQSGASALRTAGMAHIHHLSCLPRLSCSFSVMFAIWHVLHLSWSSSVIDLFLLLYIYLKKKAGLSKERQGLYLRLSVPLNPNICESNKTNFFLNHRLMLKSFEMIRQSSFNS